MLAVVADFADVAAAAVLARDRRHAVPLQEPVGGRWPARLGHELRRLQLLVEVDQAVGGVEARDEPGAERGHEPFVGIAVGGLVLRQQGGKSFGGARANGDLDVGGRWPVVDNPGASRRDDADHAAVDQRQLRQRRGTARHDGRRG